MKRRIFVRGRGEAIAIHRQEVAKREAEEKRRDGYYHIKYVECFMDHVNRRRRFAFSGDILWGGVAELLERGVVVIVEIDAWRSATKFAYQKMGSDIVEKAGVARFTMTPYVAREFYRGW